MYPNEAEGVIDKKFASLVNKKTCAKIADQLNLKKYIKTGNSYKTLKSSDEKILSDACEALIGAVYLDRGFNYVKDFILKLWEKQIKESHITYVDSKTRLQEYSLKLYKKLPVYQLVSSKGPKHDLVFKVSVCLKNTKQFIGFGNSKKEAEQNAAQNLLKSINKN